MLDPGLHPFWGRKENVTNTLCLISMCTAPQPWKIPRDVSGQQCSHKESRNKEEEPRGRSKSGLYLIPAVPFLSESTFLWLWLPNAGTNKTTGLPRVGKEIGLKLDPCSWALCGN